MKYIIYQIRHKTNHLLCYVGSTNDLHNRMKNHKFGYNKKNTPLYVTMRENGCWDDFEFIILETIECEIIKEVHEVEDKYIVDMNPCMNSIRANRNKRQWAKDNKEYIAEYNKKYNEDNKEIISEYKKKYYEQNKELISKYQNEKITCECGFESGRINMTRHKKSKRHTERLHTK